jgi:hypothetical protein
MKSLNKIYIYKVKKSIKKNMYLTSNSKKCILIKQIYIKINSKIRGLYKKV